MDFQKVFDTVNYHVLLKTLKHYDAWKIPNKEFASYLSNRKQFVSLNDYKSDLLMSIVVSLKAQY